MTRATGPELEEITDAVLLASRALVAVAARSLDVVGHDVTLAQYRALVVLASRGAQNVGELAAALGVDPSTATRLCDRLVAKRLVRRSGSPHDRREVTLTLTAKGRALVDAVTARRRREITRIVACVSAARRRALVRALRAFGEAAGEVPEQAWSLGWSLS